MVHYRSIHDHNFDLINVYLIKKKETFVPLKVKEASTSLEKERCSTSPFSSPN